MKEELTQEKIIEHFKWMIDLFETGNMQRYIFEDQFAKHILALIKMYKT
jgi:hypothetical protein